MENGKQIIENIEKNRVQFEKELHNLRAWPEWENFELKWFSVSKWPQIPLDLVTAEIESRKPFRKNGFEWHPISKNNDVPDGLYYEYYRAVEMGIKSIDPEGYRKRYLAPEARMCPQCHIDVASIAPKNCPLCGRELLFNNLVETPLEVAVKGYGKMPIMDFIAGLKSGKIKPEKVDPIRVVKYEGKLLILDSDIMYAFQQAEVKTARVIEVDPEEPEIKARLDKIAKNRAKGSPSLPYL